MTQNCPGVRPMIKADLLLVHAPAFFGFRGRREASV